MGRQPDGGLRQSAAAGAALDAALIAAHADGENARLVAPYAKAADRAEAAGETDACCIFLTQTYIPSGGRQPGAH
ncbi:MAG TPA: hypothetical protein VMM59_07055 [Thermohalobaculum sp.]|nr:hypothetical protein [Thermohalobaculum sp.]